MTWGTENKTAVRFLVGLGVFWAAYMVYSNFLSGPSSSPRPQPVLNERNTAVDLPGAAPAHST